MENHSESDYFSLFGIEKSFDINIQELEKNYFNIQKLYHPDMARKNNLSADISRAYIILKSDLERAKYLLKICANLDIENMNNQEMLEQILDDRQKLEELESFEEIEELRILKNNYKEEIIHRLSQNFKDQNYELAKLNTCYLSYVNKILEEINNHEALSNRRTRRISTE